MHDGNGTKAILYPSHHPSRFNILEQGTTGDAMSFRVINTVWDTWMSPKMCGISDNYWKFTFFRDSLGKLGTEAVPAIC